MGVKNLAILAVFAGVLTTAEPGAAQGTEEKCVDTYEQALALRKRGELTAAAARYAECTQPSCPGAVREECERQAKALAELIPTVVPAAKARDGSELVEVRVLVDGRPLTEKLDGRAHRLDPGPHTFRFEAEGEAPREIKVVLAEGERLRRIEAVLGDPAVEPAKPTGEPPIPVLAWVLGGVGVVGLAGFTYFALSGLSQESDLEKCEPTCDQSETDSLKQKYLLADISLAIGIAGLGGATYVYFSSRSDSAGDRGAGHVMLGVAGTF
jgi:hypothetical protein